MGRWHNGHFRAESPLPFTRCGVSRAIVPCGPSSDDQYNTVRRCARVNSDMSIPSCGDLIYLGLMIEILRLSPLLEVREIDPKPFLLLGVHHKERHAK